MDTEKKRDGETTDQPKPTIGDVVGDLVVSGATVLANSAAKAVVSRVKKAAAKSAPVKAVVKVVKKAKKSAAGVKAAKTRKAKKAKRLPGNRARRSALARRLRRSQPGKPPATNPQKNPDAEGNRMARKAAYKRVTGSVSKAAKSVAGKARKAVKKLMPKKKARKGKKAKR